MLVNMLDIFNRSVVTRNGLTLIYPSLPHPSTLFFLSFFLRLLVLASLFPPPLPHPLFVVGNAMRSVI